FTHFPTDFLHDFLEGIVPAESPLFEEIDIKRDTVHKDTCTKELRVGILTIVEDDVASRNSNPNTRGISIMPEKKIVLDDIDDLPNTFALRFGIIYALNTEYPIELKYTFELIQK
ncbi:hypothetical protein QTP86_016916, partial [Hemibagrus guttatus]